MQNKVVWITGASSGIGEALAYKFSKEKWSPVLKKMFGLGIKQDQPMFFRIPDCIDFVYKNGNQKISEQKSIKKAGNHETDYSDNRF